MYNQNNQSDTSSRSQHVRVITLDWKDVSDGRECHQARPPIGPVYWIEASGNGFAQ